VAAKLELINVVCPAPSSFLGGKPSTPIVAPVPLPWSSVSGDDDKSPVPPVGDPDFDLAAMTTTATIAHSWQEAGVEHQQYDVVLKNTVSTAPVASRLRVTVSGGKVVKIWNVDDAGAGAYKLPGWLLTNGGLQPGASVNFGCITSGKPAAFQITCAKL
jgi:hypothetical protein